MEDRGARWKDEKPYRGGAPALTDLMAGQVHVMFDNIPTCAEHIKAGNLRGLAVTSTARSHVLPDLPTVSEFVPGYGGQRACTASGRRRAPRPTSWF